MEHEKYQVINFSSQVEGMNKEQIINHLNQFVLLIKKQKTEKLIEIEKL